MDNAIVKRRRQELIIGGVVLAGLAVLPVPIKDVYTQNLIIITVLFAGLAQAWNILGGYCGQISLGHALYFGIGSYVSTLLYLKLGVPPTIGLFAAGIVAGAAALLIGWPCFRLSGHYYAIATVVVGEIGYLLFLNWDFIGGATGVLEQTGHIIAVQNAELGLESQSHTVLSQDANAQGMKRTDRDLLCGLADEFFDPLAHLGRGFVGEGDGGNRAGIDARLDQQCQLVGDDAGFARTCTGQNQARALQNVDGFELGVVQAS